MHYSLNGKKLFAKQHLGKAIITMLGEDMLLHDAWAKAIETMIDLTVPKTVTKLAAESADATIET